MHQGIDVVAFVVHRQHENPGFRYFIAEPARHFNAVDVGQANVTDDDVRPRFAGDCNPFQSRGCLAHHFKARLKREQELYAVTEHLMVVNQHDTSVLIGHGVSPAGTTALIATPIPCSLSIRIDPPTLSILSRMPESPRPDALSTPIPWPLSATCSDIWPSCRFKETVTSPAPLCLRTFSKHSWATRKSASSASFETLPTSTDENLTAMPVDSLNC